MDDRTPEDFVDDMLRNKRSWLDIIAVGRVVRNGKWTDDIKRILLERNLMPKDEATFRKAQIEDIARNKKDIPDKYIKQKKHKTE